MRLTSTLHLSTTFKRFPLALISAFLTTSILIFLIEGKGPEYNHFSTFLKIALTSSLGFFLFTALRLMREKNPLCLAGILSLVGYFFILPDMIHPPFIMIERHLFLALGLFIMILWSPYYKSTADNEAFWEWMQRVIFGFVTAIFFALIIYAGIAAAFAAFHILFSIKIAGERYLELFVGVMGYFSTSYFLSQIPDISKPLTPRAYSKTKTILTKYILTPLIIVYFFILYTYTFKILFSGQYPEGKLAWIIIFFSIISVITYLFWTPFFKQLAFKERRFLSLALFLQTLMLFLSLSMRVDAYGWTHNRALVGLLGLWLFGISLYFLLNKKARYKWVFISLSLLIMIGQIGPFSVYEIGKKSQQHRLQSLLKKAKANPSKKHLDISLRYAISDTIHYLHKNHGITSLQPLMPAIINKYKAKGNDDFFPSFATKELGFSYINYWEYKHDTNASLPFGLYRYDGNLPLHIAGYDWKIEAFYDGLDRPMSSMLPQSETRFILTAKTLKISEHNQTIATIPLEKFIHTIINDPSLNQYQDYDMQDDARLSHSYHDSHIKVKLFMMELNTDSNKSINMMHIKVLYKRL